MKPQALLATLLILLLSSAAAVAQSKAPERAVEGATPQERLDQMARLALQLERSSPAQVRRHSVDLSSDQLDLLASPGYDATGLYRVGVNQAMNLQLSRAGGDVEIAGAGEKIKFNVQVHSGTFYVWDLFGTAHAYTESGWTHTFYAPVRVRATGRASVTEAGVINFTAETDAFCPYNAACVINSSCASKPAAVAAASDAVGLMLWPQGPYLYICTGSLIADSDSSSEIPYFLTANHCISRNNVARNLEVFFQFTSQCGSCDDNFYNSPSTRGAKVKSSSRTSDYTLLELDQSPPAGSTYLGWNTDPVANANGTALYRISHPAGAPQAYSEHSVDTSRVTCQSWPRGDWIYSSDDLGATEGGSSGSPVLNVDGQIVGQLSGACGFNIGDVCDSASNATVDGAFAAYYNSVAQFLGSGDTEPPPPPPGECTDADGDGHCSIETGGDDCDDNNNHVYPGHNDTKGRWGRDGIDNDCNGIIDG